MILALIGLSLTLFMIAYLWVAKTFGIVDHPNHRSSHDSITIRGGGIIIPIAVLLWFVFFGFQYGYFVLATVVLATFSFADDLKDVSSMLRLVIQVVAAGLVIWGLGPDTLPALAIAAIVIFLIYWINAFNFMDGINGISASYSIVSLATFWYINQQLFTFIDQSLIHTLLLAVVIFAFFNFRKKAVCFAGDVGSVSIAFALGYLMINAILLSKDWTFIIFFSVYGIDSGLTIIERLFKGENIFSAHRSHLYQLYANEKQVNHLTISTIYGFIQLIINGCWLWLQLSGNQQHTPIYCLSIILVLIACYLFQKVKIFRVFRSSTS